MSRADKQRRRQKRKEKRQRRQRPLGSETGLARQDGTGPLSQVIISYDPILESDPYVRDVSAVLSEAEFERLFDAVHEEPEPVIPELEQLIERYPDVPTFYNWLTAAYGLAGRVADARRIAALNYERNPTYLFARINHAQMIMQEGRLQEAIEIAARFDPKAIYPHRKRFHITEISAIGALAVEYFIKARDLPAAQQWFDALNETDMDDGQLILLQMKLAQARSPGGLLGRMMGLLGTR